MTIMEVESLKPSRRRPDCGSLSGCPATGSSGVRDPEVVLQQGQQELVVQLRGSGIRVA